MRAIRPVDAPGRRLVSTLAGAAVDPGLPPLGWRQPSGWSDYERRFRLGAIHIRRDEADQARRQACDADLAGQFGEASALHREADRHENAIDRYAREIGMINQGRAEDRSRAKADVALLCPPP